MQRLSRRSASKRYEPQDIVQSNGCDNSFSERSRKSPIVDAVHQVLLLLTQQNSSTRLMRLFEDEDYFCYDYNYDAPDPESGYMSYYGYSSY